MKVLIVHVPYEHHGGEDVHVQALSKGYQEIGVEPLLFPSLREPPVGLLRKSLDSLKRETTSPEVNEAWDREKPAFIHLHNAFPVLGPRFLRWAIDRKVPMAMTVHNHRFFCTNGLALRDKRICKDCFSSKTPWRSVVYNCNGDLKKTMYHAEALRQIRRDDLLDQAVRRFVAPSPYLRGELVRFGFAKEKVLHILNPVIVPEATAAQETRYDAIYAGRLSQEKGIAELLRAVALMPELRFAIAGDGPELPIVLEAKARLANLDFVGPVSHVRALELISQSRVAVLPSICNETLSSFALEAFYQGRRCVVPALDSTSWLASGDFPGHLAKAGNPYSIAKAVGSALAAERVGSEQLQRLRRMLGFERFCGDLRKLVAEMTHA